MKQKHIILFLLLLVITIAAIACLSQRKTTNQSKSNSTQDPPTTEISGIEIPAGNSDLQIVEHPGFTLAYCEKHEQAAWVAYELTADEIAGSVSRTDRFLEDKTIHTGSATDNDYKGSGYDRGHLAPAADMKWSEEAMNASFYFSNMSPQRPSFNRGVWKRAEEQVRDWALHYDAVYVTTGPVLNKIIAQIGNNKVSVPAYYYKTVLDKKMEKAIAMLIPNEGSKAELQSFCISVDSLEALTGLDFFQRLPDEEEKRIESTCSPESWTWTH
jgi:endonuclease G